MGLLPNLGIDIVKTIGQFMTVMKSIDSKLDRLIELQEKHIAFLTSPPIQFPIDP